MSKEYDGWAIKGSWGKDSFLAIDSFRLTRKEVIQEFERFMCEKWRNYRRTKLFKLVKVKLVEVEK